MYKNLPSGLTCEKPGKPRRRPKRTEPGAFSAPAVSGSTDGSSASMAQHGSAVQGKKSKLGKYVTTTVI